MIVSSHTVNIRLWTKGGPEDGFTVPSNLTWSRLCRSMGLSQPLGFLTRLCVPLPKIHIRTGFPPSLHKHSRLVYQTVNIISPSSMGGGFSALSIDRPWILSLETPDSLSFCCVALLLLEGCTRGLQIQRSFPCSA